jgi:hypothetical protein
MPCGDEGGIQARQHLLRSADGVGADRSQRVSDAEDGEHR